MKNAAQLRAALIGKVHALAGRMGYDDGTYRTVLLTQTGKTSCLEMTNQQLSRLAEVLECLSKGQTLPDAGKPPQASANRLDGQMLPTAKQWETLAGLANRAGWKGLDDFRLLAFARHTAKVADLGELSRAAMSKVISGLSRRLAQLKAARTARQEKDPRQDTPGIKEPPQPRAAAEIEPPKRISGGLAQQLAHRHLSKEAEGRFVKRFNDSTY